MVYCNGKDCLLRDTCKRYVDGQYVIQNCEKYDGSAFIESCNPETRELLISINYLTKKQQ